MPPYILCKKSTCPKTNECYRYLAVPEKDQLYEEYLLICNSEDDFHYHMKIRSDDKIIELKNENLEELPENKCLENGIPEP